MKKTAAYHGQSVIALIAMPFAIGSMLLPLCVPIGIIGIFWHPIGLPAGLNAIAMLAISAAAGFACMLIAGVLVKLANQLETNSNTST